MAALPSAAFALTLAPNPRDPAPRSSRPALAWRTALRAKPPTFVAIDVATANRRRDSVCAIAAVRVEHGRIVERYARHVRPPTPHFEFTGLHGIRWRDVARAPSFRTLWPDLRALVEGVDFLAAHNAAFDSAALDACCEREGLPRFDLRWECTVALARRVWQMHPARLDSVARELDLPHRANDTLADAEACAGIVLRAHAA